MNSFFFLLTSRTIKLERYMCKVECWVCALHGSKMFFWRIHQSCMTSKESRTQQCLEPSLNLKMSFWAKQMMMLDGRWPGNRLGRDWTRFQDFPQRNQLDETCQSRTKMWLKGYPQQQTGVRRNRPNKRSVSWCGHTVQLQRLRFGPVTALWFSFPLASLLPTVNSDIS